ALPREPIVHLRGRPIATDPAVAEKVGRAALQKHGYPKIMRLAVEAGWIEYKPSRSGNALGQDVGFWAVFTQYAVAAGVACPVAAPAPGRGDVVAVGILVVGLIDAGLLGGAVYSTVIGNVTTITGPTAAPPVPRVAPTAVPAPTVVPTAMPTVIPTIRR